MYEGYFALAERPFSIAPDPHYLYMSSRHKEAMAHLSYGLSQGGCFIVLTGEVGTGKTTLCRNLLGDLPNNVDVALILNANINETELLQTVCDELKISHGHKDSKKQLLDLINQHLLATFADNRHTVLIIDEAQLLSRDVLEYVRLLTNLETTKSKLLQIILIGQPELNDLLSRNDLRQLAQRVTARYHLGALQRNEIEDYVNYRLSVAGGKQPLFSRQALNKMHALTSGIPRKINVLADHALLAAYSGSQRLVDAKTVKKASQDVFIASKSADRPIDNSKRWWAIAAAFLLLNIGAWWYFAADDTPPAVTPSEPVSAELSMAEKSSPRDLAKALPANTEIAAASTPETTSSDDASKLSNTPSPIATTGTTIQTSNDITPGTVQVSEDYLDASDAVIPAGSPLRDKAQNSDTRFGRLLETSADLTGRIAAVRRLASLWDVELPTPMINSACSELKRRDLACLGISVWERIVRYNRPTVMVLNHQNQLHRVILTSINGDVATVLVGDDTHRLPIRELRQRWINDSLTFWRPSPAGGRLLQPGDEYSKLGSTRIHLNRALSKANMPLVEDVESNLFDVEMSQKVFALQTRYGITGDSKIGFETYMLMNEIISPNDTPVLTNRVL